MPGPTVEELNALRASHREEAGPFLRFQPMSGGAPAEVPDQVHRFLDTCRDRLARIEEIATDVRSAGRDDYVVEDVRKAVENSMRFVESDWQLHKGAGKL